MKRLHAVLPHGVFIDINPAPSLFDSVQPDLEQTILDALDELMDAGNKRIGFIGGFGNIMGDHEYPEDPRAFAFRNWTVRLGLDVDGLVFDEGLSPWRTAVPWERGSWPNVATGSRML